MHDAEVHIIDDDDALRDALAFLFASRGLKAHGWPDAAAFLKAWHPALGGCLLLDIRMQGMSGLELYDALLARGAAQPVVFLTGHGELPMAVEALKKGAVDFVEKPFNDNNLVDRVLRALALSGERVAQAKAETALRARLATLSPREQDVFRAMITGKLNKQIADDLGITMRTVEVHRARILEKMNARNAVDLARLCAGLVQ